jgi:DNA repair photolyase
MSDHPTFVQGNLFDIPVAQETSRRTTIGKSRVEYKEARSILSAATGFIDSFDYTLNPYSGCTFACTYCYAAFFVRDMKEQAEWGQWVKVKENALDLLQKWRKKSLTGKTIYMSSVTDPYQPIERELKLSRAILEELDTHHQPRLVVQTRGALVARDIDLLKRFEHVRVNMTITTDDDEIRRVFEPSCSSVRARLEAIAQVHEVGIPTCVTMSPLLPLKDATEFAQQLHATGVPMFVVQPFHIEKGKFVAGTRKEAVRLFTERNWGRDAYQQAVAVLRAGLPMLEEGKAGFVPC